MLLTHGPLWVLSVTPAPELVKALAEVTLVLVLFSGASRVGLQERELTRAFTPGCSGPGCC